LFREDLYYRIAKTTVTIPPLRQRRADLIFWFNYFFMRYIQESDQLIKIPRMDGTFSEAMLLAEWRGNIREVEKVVTHLCLNHLKAKRFSKTILKSDPDLSRYKPAFAAAQAQPGSMEEPIQEPAPLSQHVPTREELIRDLKEYNGKIYAIAKRYGRDRKQVYRWCKRYKLDYQEFRKE